MRPRFCSLQSKEGKSPLHMAAIHGRFTRSQILIQNGEWLLLQPRAPPPLSCAAQHLPPPGCLLRGSQSSVITSQIHFCALGAAAKGPVLGEGGGGRRSSQGQCGANQGTEIPARSELLGPKNVPALRPA